MSAGDGSWRGRAAAASDAIRLAEQWRRRRVFAVAGETGLIDTESGERLVSFASNDYLGLGRDARVVAAAREALERDGAGAGAARLVTGTRPAHAALEEALAAHHGSERALVFSSGYTANVGVVSALAASASAVLSDALNHASIIDGCRLARSPTLIYRHLDLEHLSALLARTPPPALVVSELVFSMDGDAVDLPALSALCAAHGALLILDEAHGVLEVAPAAVPGELLHVGTLSKTLGSLGGYVAGAAPLVDLVENRARSYLFTTGLSPADAAAAARALQILDSAEGEALVRRLAANVALLAPGHRSPIVPVVVGGAAEALAASAALAGEGFYVPAIRPPTVPSGSSRLRATLSARHSAEEIAALAAALGRLGLTTVTRPAPPRAAPSVPTVVVVGTATDVGKTFVAVELVGALVRAGLRVAARKPLQSFSPGEGATDAERLAEASGEPPHVVTDDRFSYPAAAAPPIAARRLGRPEPRRGEVLGWLAASLLDAAGAPAYDVAVVELVGGLRSPHALGADGLALLGALRPAEVLLVAPAGLGALNDVALATEAIGRALPGVACSVLLNRFDRREVVHRENLEWLLEERRGAVFAGDGDGRARCYAAIAATFTGRPGR